MDISRQDFSGPRLRHVFKKPVPRVLLSLIALLLAALVVQGWWHLTAAPLDTASAVEIDMRIVPGQWEWEPSEVSVPAGSTVQMRITNDDPYDHGFAIAELGVDERLPANATSKFAFVADAAPGRYDFYCSVFCGAGHFSQRGTLEITPAEAGVATATAPDTADPYADVPVRSRDDAIDELPYTVDDDGTKVFSLSIEEVMWDYGDGNPIYSWGYEGQLPGPDIRVTEGDRVRVVVENELPDGTTVHWHGIDVEWEADGVPGITQYPIAPGETYVYEFTATPAGTRIYHTHGSHHGDEGEQIDMGLAGALIVEPADFEPPDVDVTWVLTERIQAGVYPIHGAIFPAVPPITVREGDRVRVRLINAGSATFHPMHLHGHQYRVVAIDGNPVPEDSGPRRNTQPIMPGETYDIEFIADNPGVWLFHCHQLQHAAGGMISTVQYEGFDAPDFTTQDALEHTDGAEDEHNHDAHDHN